MEFTAQPETTTFFTAHPEPFHLFWLFVAFVVNFFYCRYISIRLVKKGYIAKYPVVSVKRGKKTRLAINTKAVTEEYRKLFLCWFFPVFGAFAITALYITCAGIKYAKLLSQKLFLSHL